MRCDLRELLVGQIEAANPRGALVFQQVAAQRVAEALRLLADLLQHEVRVAAPLDRGQVPLDLRDRLADPVGVQRAHPVALAGQHHHLAVVEVDHRAGVLEQRRGVRRDEPLVLAHAHQQRRALARRDQHVRLVGRDEREPVGALDVAQRERHRLLEVAAIELADEMRQHLGVGLGAEGMAALDERLPDRGGVLDDAVVDDRDLAGLVGVRMRVGRGGRAVRGPAGMPDAEGTARQIAVELLLERGQLAGGLVDLEAVAVDDRDAGGVVAAVLEAPEPVDEQVRRWAGTDVSDNAAHSAWILSGSTGSRAAATSASASAAVGASAISRTIGSVPDGRTCSHRSRQASRSPSRSSAIASGKRRRSRSYSGAELRSPRAPWPCRITYAGRAATTLDSEAPTLAK